MFEEGDDLMNEGSLGLVTDEFCLGAERPGLRLEGQPQHESTNNQTL